MINNLKEDIEYDVCWSMKELLRYVKTDFDITVSMSPEQGIKIDIQHKNECLNRNDNSRLSLNDFSREECLDFEEDISDKELVSLAQKAPCTLLAEKKIGRTFFQNSFGISKSQTPFLESFLGQRIDDLRGKYVRIILHNKIYFAHFTTTRTITGNALSIRIEWPKCSALSYKLNDLLKEQYDFFMQHREAKCLPKELDVSFEFYAINGTKSFKLVLSKA